MMPISKDTQLCISVAQHPGNFGTMLFNAGFKKLNIDYVYKAFKLRPGELKAALDGVRVLRIRGCGVSMPFKVEAASYMDSLDFLAERIGAINTIVNTAGRLKGYNTDCWGALQVLKKIKDLKDKKVVMLGAGGVAQAISCALEKLKVRDVMVVNRERKMGQALVKKWGWTRYVSWRDRDLVRGDLLINATPVGMLPQSEKCPVRVATLSRFDTVMDMVISPLETQLMKRAQDMGKRVIPGYEMSLHQAIRQFELYTGRPAPVKVMREQIINM